MELVLKDSGTGLVTRYLLAANTTLNGQPLSCGLMRAIGQQSWCDALPSSLIAGKTLLAVLYWDKPFSEFALYRGTDTLISI